MTKKVTAHELFEMIAGRTESTTLRDKLMTILAKFEGKTITKRVATAVDKALPEYTVYYSVDKVFGFRAELSLWKGSISGRVDFCLGHGKTFTMEGFKEANPADFAADTRNVKRVAYLESGKAGELADAINATNAAVANLKALLAECPEPFAAEELVDVDKLGYYSKS